MQAVWCRDQGAAWDSPRWIEQEEQAVSTGSLVLPTDAILLVIVLFGLLALMFHRSISLSLYFIGIMSFMILNYYTSRSSICCKTFARFTVIKRWRRLGPPVQHAVLFSYLHANNTDPNVRKIQTNKRINEMRSIQLDDRRYKVKIGGGEGRSVEQCTVTGR